MQEDHILTQSPIEVVDSSSSTPDTGVVDSVASTSHVSTRKKIKSFKKFCKDTSRQQDEQIVVRCSSALKRQLHEDSINKNKKMAEIVRRACREYLARKEHGGDR